jgi:DNA polymerase-3 subunit gamma/tau
VLAAGPSGCGKTTVARIFAKALNCEQPVDGEPCNSCDSCNAIEAGNSFDVVELDAASNGGVDAIRALIDTAHRASPGRWKVYILDEAHRISKAGAEAFLKTLEEPPRHVVFVLATTDPQSLLATLRNRCATFEFRSLSVPELTEHLTAIADAEGLDVDAAVIDSAARRANGQVRQAISNLESAALIGADVHSDTETWSVRLADAITSGEPANVIVPLAEALADGIDPLRVGADTLTELRARYLICFGTPELSPLTPTEERNAAATSAGLPVLIAAWETLGNALVDAGSSFSPAVTLEISMCRAAANAARRQRSAA